MNRISQKKILFVATQFPPNDSIGTQRIVKFIKYLRLRGWEIHVLTLEEKYHKNSSNSYQSYLPKDIHVYRRKKIEIFRLWDTIKKLLVRNPIETDKFQLSSDGDNQKNEIKNDSQNLSVFQEIKELVSNLLQYPDQHNGFFFNVFFTAFRLISKYDIDYLFVSSPPHSPVIPLTLLRKFKRFFYIIDFRDPWARSQWQQKPKHVYQKIAKRLDLFFEKTALEASDVAIFNTEQLQKEFIGYYENTLMQRKFHFVSNGFDPELKDKFSNRNHKKNKTDGKIRILHTGTLYKKRNPEIIFEGLAKFREIDPQNAKTIEIDFIGSLSDDLQYLRQLVKAKCLSDQIKFRPKLPYDKIIDQMKIADWLLLLQPGTTFQIPAKFYDYLLVDKPIWGVLEENSVGEDAIKKLDIGYVSYCQSVDSIVEFFKYITSGKKIYYRPDKLELQKYSLPYLVDKFEQILLSCQD